MAAKRRGIVVYHGTTSKQPPHEVFQREGVFHAGTREAAVQRLNDLDALDMGDDYEEVAQPTIHAYEITPKAPMSLMTYSDPHYDFYESNPEEFKWRTGGVENEDYDKVPNASKYSSKEMQVNRGDITQKIKKYTNIIEDTGSLSYQIPVHLVPNKIRYLGPQFYGYNPDTEDPSSDVELVPEHGDWWKYK